MARSGRHVRLNFRLFEGIVGTLYTTGGYLKKNPTWHAEDSAWKAARVVDTLTPEMLLEIKDHLTIAEIGCGAGGVIHHLTGLLTARGYAVRRAIGYDISDQAIELARNQHPGTNVEFIRQDFIRTSDRFSLGLVIDVVEHLQDPDEFLCEISHRFSYVVLHVPLEDNLEFRLRRKGKDSHEKVGHMHFFSKASAMSLLNKAGLIPLKWIYTSASIDLLRIHGTIKSYIGILPRYLLFRLNRDAAARIFAHFSIMLLCRGKCQFL